MTDAMAYPMAGAMASPIWPTQCDFDATERDGTGRNERATKTTTEIPSVLDRSGPVDNGEIDHREDRWMVADEQFAFFLEGLTLHAGRMTRLTRERFRPSAAAVRERAFDEETARMRAFLRGQVAA